MKPLITLLMIGSILLQPVMVFAQITSEGNIEDINAVFSNQEFYDPTDTECRDGTSLASSPYQKNVYLLGDSWLVGAEAQLQRELPAANFFITGLNAVTGRSINGAGQGQGVVPPSNALDAVDVDGNLIANAGNVVIMLGTNPDNYSEAIPLLIEKIRSTRFSGKIYWVNTAATDNSIYKEASDANAAIIEHSTTQKYSIIDWFSRVFPGGDPTNINPDATSQLMSSDQIHPSENGYVELAKVISQSLSGAGQINTAGSISGGTTGSSITYGSRTLPSEWLPIIANAASRFKVDPNILVGILYNETGWATPASFATNPQRNSATATGPFQFLDNTARDYMPAPDEFTGPSIRNLSHTSSVVIRYGGTGSDREPDGSYIVDGNKDGRVSRATPEDAALMAAAYLALVNGTPDIPLGNEGEPVLTVAQENGTTTVRSVAAHYNQGPNWSSDKPIQGNNPVFKYMRQTAEITKIGREGGVFAGTFGGQIATCGSIAATAGTMQWPVRTNGQPSGSVTACWSDLRHKTLSGGSYYHSGVDIGAAGGTEVVAVLAGKVVFSGVHRAYGNLIIIDHQNGRWSHYGHLSEIETAIIEGVSVSAGQRIGAVGNTGISLGNHLHLNFYDRWPFGELPQGAANDDGTKTINPLTNGLTIPSGVPDEVGCANYPNGGREVYIEL